MGSPWDSLAVTKTADSGHKGDWGFPKECPTVGWSCDPRRTQGGNPCNRPAHRLEERPGIGFQSTFVGQVFPAVTNDFLFHSRLWVTSGVSPGSGNETFWVL